MNRLFAKSMVGMAALLLVCSFQPTELLAQNKGGAGRPSGGQRPAAKPASGQRPTAKPANAQRPAAKPANAQRPSSKPAVSKQPAAKPSNNVQRPTTSAKNPSGRPGGSGQISSGKSGNRDNGKGNGRDVQKPNVSNNKVNIDKSRGDVNINIDNSKDVRVRNTRNTVVRHNTYRPPYSRPPYRYGGYRYRCYRPYYYHPYRPFYWGPRWHPWGFFVATLATTAIIVSFADADIPPVMHNGEYFVFENGWLAPQHGSLRSGPSAMEFDPPTDLVTGQKEEYYYDEGVFYLKGDGGYTVVAAPLGGIIKTLPEGYETVDVDEEGKVKNYYYGGTFYEKVSNGYKVVPATSGVLVSNLSSGGEEVKLGDVTYVKLGETYYQPVKENGKDMYEVVEVEEDK